MQWHLFRGLSTAQSCCNRARERQLQLARAQRLERDEREQQPAAELFCAEIKRPHRARAAPSTSEIKDGKQHGKGTETPAEGHKYVPSTLANGTVYHDGEWENGEPKK